VTAALDNYAKALSYANADHAALTDWQPATKLVTMATPPSISWATGLTATSRILPRMAWA